MHEYDYSNGSNRNEPYGPDGQYNGYIGPDAIRYCDSDWRPKPERRVKARWMILAAVLAAFLAGALFMRFLPLRQSAVSLRSPVRAAASTRQPSPTARAVSAQSRRAA